MTRRFRIPAALLLATGLTVAPAAAQSAAVSPVQPLWFGLLLPGVPETVTVGDASRRGMVAVSGAGAVDITFILPDALSSPEGATIPLRFGAASAALLDTPSGTPAGINPMQVTRVHPALDKTVYLLLGATASPSPGQRAGRYTARIVLLCSQPGT